MDDPLLHHGGTFSRHWDPMLREEGVEEHQKIGVYRRYDFRLRTPDTNGDEGRAGRQYLLYSLSAELGF